MFNPEANSPHLLSLETAELLRAVSLPDTLGQECAQELISFLSQENRNETVQASSLDSSSDIRDSISNENVACTVSGKLRCSIVGSNVSGTSTHPHLNTDVVVMMPDSMFEETDVLNNVYFEKRKLFVAFLGMTVRKWISSKSEMMLETALFKGDPRKPILVLYLPQKTSSIRIYPSLSPTVHLKMTALRLDKNNVRPHWWNSKSSGKKRKVADNESKEALDPSQLLPTPHYNMAILEDAVLGTVTDMVCKVCSYCPVAKDILILAKVWLHQCSLRYRVDALDSTSTAMLIAYLVQSNVINKSMNPIQGFLVFVESLGKWRSRGTIFQFASLLKSEAEKEQWMNTFSCCLLQPVMSVLNNEKNNNRPIHLVYNMLWRVSSSGWNDVQREATRASMLLKQALSRESIGNARTASLGGMVGLDAFQCIFLNKRTLCQQYDQLFHVSLKFRNGENPYYQLLSNQCCNETLIARIAKYLRVALRYALTDRISTLAVIPRWEECTAHCGDNASRESHPIVNAAGEWAITIAMNLNQHNAYRRVDRDSGKSLRLWDLMDDQKVPSQLDFASFWGSKCQLRRFQDGDIVHAAVWGKAIDGSDAMSQGETIVQEIVTWCVENKLVQENFGCTVSCTSSLIQQKMTVVPTDDSTPSFSTLNSSRIAVEALDQLRILLTSKMQGLPLYIDSLSAASSYLRYTSILPLRPHPLAFTGAAKREQLHSVSGQDISRMIPPVMLIATLESSGNWPEENHTAFERMKSAYLVNLAERLLSEYEIESYVLEEEFPSCCLDIIFMGYVFRVFLACRDAQGRVILLGNTATEDENPLKPLNFILKNDSSTMQKLTTFYELNLLHHQFIHSIHAAHPTGLFSDCVRLVQVWLASKLLSDILPHEAVELIVASVFNNDVAPTTVAAAFYRFLLRVARHNWKEVPLYVCNHIVEKDAPAFDGSDSQDGDSDIHVAVVPSMKRALMVQDKGVTEKRVYDSFKRAQKNNPGHVCMFITTTYERDFDYPSTYTCDAWVDNVSLQILQRQANASANMLQQAFEGGKVDVTAIAKLWSAPDEIVGGSNLVIAFHPHLQRSSTDSVSRNQEDLIRAWSLYCHGSSATSIRVFANLPAKQLSPANLIVRSASFPSPIQSALIDKIRKRYGDSVIVFWNHLRGDKAYVVFRPTASAFHNFSVLHCHHKYSIAGTGDKKESSKNALMMLNVSELKASIQAMGGGSVSHITIR